MLILQLFSTKNIPITEAGTEFKKATQRVQGVDKKWQILIIPAIPNMKEAIDKAIENKECVMVMQVHHAQVLHAQDVAEWVVQALAMDSATRNVITENNIRYQC